MSDFSLIEFPIGAGKGQHGPGLVYRPFSVRTLKLRILAGDEDVPPFRLRPKRVADKGQTNITAGFADSGDAFIIGWGGGHEDGPCIFASDDGHIEACGSLPAGKSSNIFLNLTHVGPDVPETAELTLEAYDELDHSSNSVKASITIQLQRPSDAPDVDEFMRFEQTADDVWEIGSGRQLPHYDPRWWPLNMVSYQKLGDAPPVKIVREDNVLSVFWGDQEDPIISLTDQTEPSILTGDASLFDPGGFSFELFEWNDNFFVLRMWFSWLNLSVPHKVLLLVRKIVHEVPDAERFDFLIRKKNGRIPLACTDLHWREFWGWRELKDLLNDPDMKTVEAVLGLGLNVAPPLALLEATDRLVRGPKLNYDILLEFVKRQADEFARQDDEGLRTVLGPGDQAHVPVLANLEHGPTLTSRDVRFEF